MSGQETGRKPNAIFMVLFFINPFPTSLKKKLNDFWLSWQWPKVGFIHLAAGMRVQHPQIKGKIEKEKNLNFYQNVYFLGKYKPLP